jgi:hypothetical protein
MSETRDTNFTRNPKTTEQRSWNRPSSPRSTSYLKTEYQQRPGAAPKKMHDTSGPSQKSLKTGTPPNTGNIHHQPAKIPDSGHEKNRHISGPSQK